MFPSMVHEASKAFEVVDLAVKLATRGHNYNVIVTHTCASWGGHVCIVCVYVP